MKKGHPRTGEEIVKHREQNKRWYLKTAETRRRKSREWAQQNPEKKKAYLDGWNERNAKHVEAYRKKRYAENRERVKQEVAQWRLKNKEKQKRYALEYYQKNKEKLSLNAKIKRQENREYIRIRSKVWRDKNSENLKKKAREFMAKRRKESLSFKMAQALRSRLRTVMVRKKCRKSDRMLVLLGCNLTFFLKYIESQFVVGMSWGNYGKGEGKWSLDHKIPCSHFQLQDLDHQKKCFHYTNLQPMWDLDNIRKGDRVASPYRPEYLPVECSA